MKACCFAMRSVLSAIPSSVAMRLASRSIFLVLDSSAFYFILLINREHMYIKGWYSFHLIKSV